MIFYPLGDGSEYGVSVGYAKYMENIVIPAYYNGKPVTTILEYGFVNVNMSGAIMDNITLKSITIPEGIKKIEAYAFAGCGQLENINIPKTVEEIGEDAFYGVQKVTFKFTEAEFNAKGLNVDAIGAGEIEYKPDVI